jgi:hypothetical protein
MIMPSHARDGAIEESWLRQDIDAKSCWLRCYRGDLTTLRCRCQVMLVMVLELKVVLAVARLHNP